jgi:hypothetical protein
MGVSQRDSAQGASSTLQIHGPIHGAILNRHHGETVDGGLKIEVTGQAPANQPVTVSGVPARRAGVEFFSDVVLSARENEIVVSTDGSSGHSEQRIRVVWDQNSRPRYRFTIDDNVFFLRDISQNNYSSLFECFYLDLLRKVHEAYGTRFCLNLYFTTGDGFDLTQVSERYKPEWRDNADWLKLSFHAYSDKPDRPYQYAPAEKLLADWDLVTEQIIRFAGEESYAIPTVIHWAMVQPAGVAALARKGVRALSGQFRRANGGWDINYFVDDHRSEYLSRHDALMDWDTGIVFSRRDLICNNTPLEQIAPRLDALAQDPNTRELMDFNTHEQYFWPFYRNYLPDHPQRVEAAARWAAENGYEPVFFCQGFLGASV